MTKFTSITQMLEVYTAKAIKEGLAELTDSGFKVTEKGAVELMQIAKVCYDMVNVDNILDNLVKTLETQMGRTLDPVKTFNSMLMLAPVDSDVRLLAFYMHERDNGYEHLKQAISDDLGKLQPQEKKPSLSVVKKGQTTH